MSDIGDYFAASGGLTGSASAQNLLSIENPSSPGTTNVFVRLIRATSGVNALSTTVFAVKLGRTTGVPTGGTTLTAIQRDTASAAPKAIVRTGPTATFASGLIATMTPGAILGLTLSGSFVPEVLPLLDPDGIDVILVPGEALLVGAEANSTSWVHYVGVEWGENARV